MKRDTSWQWRHTAAANLNLTGLKAIVIGGTGGIGRAISRTLADRGAHVTVVGRSFRDPGVSGLDFIRADLSSMREAKRLAEQLPVETSDLVVFTTGIFAGSKRKETLEGIEQDLAISYLNRFVILREIGPRLGIGRKSARLKPRVVIVGFPGTGQTGDADNLNSERSYKTMPAHMNTVAGNEVLVLDAVNRYPLATFFGLNPGVVKSNIRENLFGGGVAHKVLESVIGLFASSPEAYANRIVPLIVSPELEAHSGAMFNNKAEPVLATEQLTPSYAAKFISASERLARRAGAAV